jgi:hypothetical protein
MAVARITVLIQDAELAQEGQTGDITENLDLKAEDFYLAGPVSRRVAVVDFDPANGDLVPGAPYTPPKPGRVRGRFATERVDETDPGFPHWVQTNAYGLVLKTMELFEESDVLGRPVRWGFDGPQLLVVPRAGKDENAFYERASRSLQFFFFDSRRAEGRTVYTALSRDIVAHETGHAVLDGIAPDLYLATSPQSLALHEAIADLTALHMALRSDRLREDVLVAQDFVLTGSTPFNSIAEEFGRGRGENGSLRDLANQLTMQDVRFSSPHDVSQVLSGSLWSLLMRMYDFRREFERKRNPDAPLRQTAGKAFALAAERFRRITLRALDYLPPGEASFADYGRAVIASDQAANPDTNHERDWLREEFVARKITEKPDDLDVDPPFDDPAMADVNLEGLLSSDYAAHRFVEANRPLFGVPADAAFTVQPRLSVRKKIFLGQGREPMTNELLFKVSWEQEELNLDKPGLPAKRRYTVGTTLVIDADTHRVRARLSSADAKDLSDERDELIRALYERGDLRVGDAALGPTRSVLPFVVHARADGDVMRVRDGVSMLHMTGTDYG